MKNQISNNVKFCSLLLVAIFISLTQFATGQDWSLTGNAATDPSTNFIGTTDNFAFKIRTKNLVRITVNASGKVGIGTASPIFKLDVKSGSINTDSVYRIKGNAVLSVKGTSNTFVGTNSGFSMSTGFENSANGFQALYSNTTGNYNTANGSQALYSNTTGYSNTANGDLALYSNTTGAENTANGDISLFNNTSGSKNTANGSWALYSNTTGTKNTAVGNMALFSNTTGYSNVAIGTAALYNNSTGYRMVAIGDSSLFNQTVNSQGEYDNVAVGNKALYSNTIGNWNTANGSQALYSNTTGTRNSAIGYRALYSNTDGDLNTAIGNTALYSNTTGSGNTAIGSGALFFNTDGSSNTAVGYLALYNNYTGTGNTAFGFKALYYNTAGQYNTVECSAFGNESYVSTGAQNATVLGALATVNASNKVRIGNTNVSIVESQVGSWTTSDGRFKTNIKEEVKGLEFIKKLRPVIYNFDTRRFDEFLMQEMADSAKQSRMKGRDDDYKRSTDLRHNGFIAQEVEQAAKECEYDFGGVHHPESAVDNWSLSYENFVVPLVKSVQELDKTNEELKMQNAELKNEIELIKSALTAEQQQKINELKNKEGAILEQNTPNPFSQNTVIKFYIPSSTASALIKIADAHGNELKVITISERDASQISISANTLPAGVYSYQLIVNNRCVDTKLMVITK